MKHILTLLVLIAALAAPAFAAQKPASETRVVVVINTNLGDKAFSDLVWKGVTEAQKDLGLKEIKAIELMGDATKQVPTLAELAESEEWDLILAGTFNLKEAVQEVAREFPEQKFLVYDTQIDFDKADYSNCYSVMAMQNEGTFLAGALAAMMTQKTTPQLNPEKVIGFVGGGENSAINDFLVGYIEGAKYIDPATKVLFSYIGDFRNASKGKELALAQYQQGADIVIGVAGAASLGVLDAAKSANKLAMGVDQDHALLVEATDPEMAEHIPTSVLKNLDRLLHTLIGKYVDGTLEFGQHEFAGLALDGMSLADNKYYRSLIPADVIAKVEAIRQEVVDGKIKVPTAIGLSQEEEGVKGHYEGSHSPFGLIYQIARDTGWPVEYILNLPHATLVMMLADAPRYISGESKEKEIKITSKEQLMNVLGGSN